MLILAHQPAGLLVTGFERSDAAREMLGSYTSPIVTLMELSDAEEDYCVGFSQYEAGAAMTRKLLERGYRHIAFAAAQLDPRTLQRAEGYRQTMRETSRYDAALQLLTPQVSSIGLGAELLGRLLAQHPSSTMTTSRWAHCFALASWNCRFRSGWRSPGSMTCLLPPGCIRR